MEQLTLDELWAELSKWAKKLAYEAVAKISFKGMFYRKDIADKALQG